VNRLIEGGVIGDGRRGDGIIAESVTRRGKQ